MYLFIVDSKETENGIRKEIVENARFKCAEEIIEISDTKNTEFIEESGRCIIPLKKEDSDLIYKNSETAKNLIKKAHEIFLIRKNIRVRLK